jgi:hypothetical protein
MSYTVFTQVNYRVDALLKDIDMGVIGLPDIQRPFIWKNAKVRDLFDSMYRGYPIGYLLFWRNAATDDARNIGVEHKQKTPSLLIVDGQQRLTSLFSVINGIEIIRENYKKEKLKIAFDPLLEKFEVTDAAILRDKSYIPDISTLWDENCDLFVFVDEYLKGVKETHEITSKDEAKIKKSITSLQALRNFPLTALELSKDITEEHVAEVFVRVNSKGTPLNQADFILTLMSVFWDDGRMQLESFCREAKSPSTGRPSPFNYFIKPSPDQLLRVCVGLAFKRARLRYIYSILRGKDLETEQFSEERREQQFSILKAAQKKVLNLTYWHDFLKCIRLAGFMSGKLISSQTNLMYTYVFYLIGRAEYNIETSKLRKVIAQWFFMTSLTGRYTGSAETAMESDLARFRGVKDGEEFLSILQKICALELTDDYWKITLPNSLATSSPRSPSLFAYNAALVKHNANALFSELKVSNLLDPASVGQKSSVERHHLFPKGYLKNIGITDIRETNQIANYTYVEYGDNIRISDQSPSEYLPKLKPEDRRELNKMYKWHALPLNWEFMDYQEFLEKRRELMAKVIHDAYKKLRIDKSTSNDPLQLTLEEMIKNGETHQIEFKATLRTNLHTNQKDAKMEFSVIKTIAGFLNSYGGGKLTIGIYDDGDPVGLDVDGFENEDKMALHLVNLIKSKLGVTNMSFIHIHFDDFKSHRILVVECSPAVKPIYFKDGDKERFFIRTGPSTTELSTRDAIDFIKERF